MRVGFLYHDIFLKHLEGYSHVESPERLKSILSRLERSDIGDSLVRIEPGPASRELIELVHSPSYVDGVLSLEVDDHVVLDWGDTVATRYSVDAALYAAGAGVDAARRILAGEIVCRQTPGTPRREGQGDGVLHFQQYCDNGGLSR